MRTGGFLAQYAPPAELLTRPADDFVASFVGKDRGYRSLSFVDSSGVEVGRGADGRRRRRRRVLFGLAARGGRGQAAAGLGRAGRRRSCPAARCTRSGASIRGALDAALSSPSGLGVAVDADGRLAGVVTARQVLDVIESRRG